MRGQAGRQSVDRDTNRRNAGAGRQPLDREVQSALTRVLEEARAGLLGRSDPPRGCRVRHPRNPSHSRWANSGQRGGWRVPEGALQTKRKDTDAKQRDVDR